MMNTRQSAPALSTVKTIAAGNLPASFSALIAPYSANYYETTLPTLSCLGVGMLARSKAAGDFDQEPMAYALVGVTADDRVVQLSRGMGLEFSRTLVVSPDP